MIRLAVRCRPELADIALAELLEVAPGGVEEERGDGYVELAIYGPPGEIPALGEIAALVGGGLIEVTTAEIPDDWADRWRDFHRPVEIAGGRIVVRPSWHAPGTESPAAPDEPGGRTPIEVVVDPGQAFGTGAHPTTRLCLELMLELADAGRARGAVCDLGTGSAVLAIAAAKLGWAPVLGVDHEPAALEASRENAAANGVTIDIARVNLRQQSAPTAPTVIANLTAPLLAEVAERLERPPDALVCSGLLGAEAEAVASAFAAGGLAVSARRDSGEWAALLLEHDSGPARQELFADPRSG